VEITIDHCRECANLLEVEPEILQTVARVESLGDPTAYLFEPHVFSRITNHRYDITRPQISYPIWDRKKYPKTQKLRDEQFRLAVATEPFKAFEAASWGIFQIMGYHYKLLGFGSALSMSTTLKQNVEANVLCFGAIVKDMNLQQALRDKNWAAFAKKYNGPSYKLNHYDTKMAAEYDRITASRVSTSA
jgi:hypothetical protein